MKSNPDGKIGYYDQSGRCRFNTLKGFFLQSISDIAYVKANGNYCTIHLIDGEEKLVTYTLAYVSKMLLPLGFRRIGRSSVINLNYLAHVNRQSNTCLLDIPSGKLDLSISHRYVKELSELF
ncbi:MAG: LytTR family transcriptional regulator [Bacteroidetes bacterium]|jgi:DNA-binding LytR/AlgR family response regulator|nr:LytTR family transcriptional regulator [Bacteroidota bacterium]MBT3748939.1 LytTR family transcriptional regulator [Bacteroidota bacterium]MBT4401837.1 LytTR family transcriptional regulator [Bacteroidota bacterium]MBT4411266.1 LytTR family transcriptional regulator [Bacteroidota bacterium]MBT5425707.1 LytTR family transcriptional regulator [Bacteroidota bacterium]